MEIRGMTLVHCVCILTMLENIDSLSHEYLPSLPPLIYIYIYIYIGEANRLRKLEEEKETAATNIQAWVRRYFAQLQFPQLLEENADRLRDQKQREQLRVARQHAAIRIQCILRRYLPRKRYLHVRECRRRRLANEKEIKRIQKVLKHMPKTTKSDIKVRYS